mmetsp:Transcript_7195/g.13659  ORF Transcript_7195/g.13659 Transcript_7195/m.13659 type:complete len:221 (+) Transcript_7195:269-931(+)
MKSSFGAASTPKYTRSTGPNTRPFAIGRAQANPRLSGLPRAASSMQTCIPAEPPPHVSPGSSPPTTPTAGLWSRILLLNGAPGEYSSTNWYYPRGPGTSSPTPRSSTSSAPSARPARSCPAAPPQWRCSSWCPRPASSCCWSGPASCGGCGKRGPGTTPAPPKTPTPRWRSCSRTSRAAPPCGPTSRRKWARRWTCITARSGSSLRSTSATRSRRLGIRL